MNKIADIAARLKVVPEGGRPLPRLLEIARFVGEYAYGFSGDADADIAVPAGRLRELLRAVEALEGERQTAALKPADHE